MKVWVASYSSGPVIGVASDIVRAQMLCLTTERATGGGGVDWEPQPSGAYRGSGSSNLYVVFEEMVW